jgi:hypothetical protein
MYCDYFIWCVSCTVVVLTCFVMCGCVGVGFVMRGCFGNCVGVLVICELVFAMFCIFCTEFFKCFFYIYIFFFVSSVLE